MQLIYPRNKNPAPQPASSPEKTAEDGTQAAEPAEDQEAEPGAKPKRILVIRLGALGDIVLCFQAFHEIREADKDAEIAFLTMPAFAEFAQAMPWFDRVIVDPRPAAQRIDQWIKLVKDVSGFKPNRVYDLQGKPRQSILFALLGGPWGPQWSGAAPLCSHPRLAVPSQGMHFTDYLEAQLQLADVPTQPPADLSWLDASVDGFSLPARFAVLVPGCAPLREYKRWPPRKYASLAAQLQKKGIPCIAVGTKQDTAAIAAIRSAFPGVLDFSGRTTLLHLAGIMRRAECVIANDTGPMHIAAAIGTPTLALMSEQVDAVWNAPHGPRVQWLQGKPLANLGVDKVLLALEDLLAQKK